MKFNEYIKFLIESKSESDDFKDGDVVYYKSHDGSILKGKVIDGIQKATNGNRFYQINSFVNRIKESDVFSKEQYNDYIKSGMSFEKWKSAK
jgi:hypothetical protein